MSFETITRFLDALYAWYQAGEPASGDEVTPVHIDLVSVHEAYHQLDQTQRDETAVLWSHLLQVCKIRSTWREGIWMAIENLALKLGFDCSYFDGSPQLAEPEPTAIEEQPTTERHVRLAKFFYYSLYKEVHSHRPDGIVDHENMDEVERFLAQLGAIVVSLPALSTEGLVPPRGESLAVLERDVTLLFRFHDALPKAGKEAIEREWTELASAVSSPNPSPATSQGWEFGSEGTSRQICLLAGHFGAWIDDSETSNSRGYRLQDILHPRRGGHTELGGRFCCKRTLLGRLTLNLELGCGGADCRGLCRKAAALVRIG